MKLQCSVQCYCKLCVNSYCERNVHRTACQSSKKFLSSYFLFVLEHASYSALDVCIHIHIALVTMQRMNCN